MDLRDLLAVFIVEESNFNVLHWCSQGPKFDRDHALALEWYERCAANKDTVAEMGMRCGLNPVSYGEAIKLVEEIEGIGYEIVSSSDRYDFDKFMAKAQSICKVICQSIAVVLNSDEIQKKPENVGIKATLESMYEDWDLDLRYKNINRMK